MSKRGIRQAALLDLLKLEPFCTDDELAARFGVSVQTIRLDRMALGIPEVRERTRALAEGNHQVTALDVAEVIGEILEIIPEHSGASLLEIGAEHVFQRTQIARGHHLFAQANSLAVAIIPYEVVLTFSAAVKYIRPVKLGERLYCRGHVEKVNEGRYTVKVQTKVGLETVFKGRFVVVKVSQSAQGLREEGDIS